MIDFLSFCVRSGFLLEGLLHGRGDRVAFNSRLLLLLILANIDAMHVRDCNDALMGGGGHSDLAGGVFPTSSSSMEPNS